MNYLFIGGCVDGQRINMPDNFTNCRIPHAEGYDEYRVERLSSPSQSYTVYVENHLTLSSAMKLLIDNYVPKLIHERYNDVID